MLSNEAIEYARRSVLCWLATVDAHGVPNVSPKEAFAVCGREHLVIANIASPTSVRNMAANPNVCASYIDVFVQKGFKIFGKAEYITRTDARYARFEAPLLAITGGAFPIQGIMAVHVASIEAIVAPSYSMIAGTTEASQTAAALSRYGVAARGPAT